MANIASVLKEEISRLARKEVRSQTQRLQKTAAQYRRDIAALKRHAAELAKKVASIGRQTKKGAPQGESPPATEKIRFSAKGLRSHRGLLGLSAADYGQLVGVTGHTIYKWEQGDTHPRQAQLAALAPVRGLGKKDAIARLAQLRGKTATARKNKK